MSGSDSTQSVWIHGHSGRMGQAIKAAIAEQKFPFVYVGGSAEKFDTKDDLNDKEPTKQTLSAKLDAAQMIVDFSAPQANELLLETLCMKNRTGQCVLIGTTGLDRDVLELWQKIAGRQNLRVMHAPNTSLGILLLAKMTKDLTRLLRPRNFDIEISEAHHRGKIDSPSGTALLLAENAQTIDPSLHVAYGRTEARHANEIGIQSLRGGHVFGEHTVLFLGEHEEVHIGHRALSRHLFASGALTLAKWLSTWTTSGFYSLDDVEIKDLLV